MRTVPHNVENSAECDAKLILLIEIRSLVPQFQDTHAQSARAHTHAHTHVCYWIL